MTSQDSGILWREFATEFVQETLSAATKRAGRVWTASAIHAQGRDAEPDTVWVQIAFSGSVHGGCLLGFSKADADTLTLSILAGEDRQDSENDRAGEALVNAFSAAAADLTATARNSYGSFTLSIKPGDGAGLVDSRTLVLEMHDDHACAIAVIVRANEELIESLGSCRNEENGTERGSSPRADNGLPLSLFGNAPNLELLMDVELDVTLRFGQRHLTLREVLDLTSGSVVELDRQVEEPVELILDGKVIARGEAVVIDGNYGLRVTDIPHPLNSRQLGL